ncbi:HD domain-containing protein [Photobacterium sp. SDRW27]|uniref:HD-GYP domain-containing protein n=1 Tax=Photobacterium obscurum TaxID=2829490 RepID=UPI0022436C36|nr:HD domain-containing phosphohydrolase [Photobacterium obscurum]MCW8331900.1 HD domain-containing protein [Photobacterium obscurum]
MYELSSRIKKIHKEIINTKYEIDRTSIALLDDDGYLRTYVDSTNKFQPLKHHSQKLSEARSLNQLAISKECRIIDNYSTLLSPPLNKANSWLLENKLLSSYTVPVYFSDRFLGFIFFNSRQEAYFSAQTISKLQTALAQIKEEIISERLIFDKITSLNQFAEKTSEIRDIETSKHCVRLRNLARIISTYVAKEVDISDYHIFQLIKFAPLHDIGKICTPDRILHKKGRLTAEEYQEIKQHVEHGLAIFDAACDEMMRQHTVYGLIQDIIGCHHEMLDGSGYPKGLSGNQINMFSRIVTVADIFDALTSERPYKKAWSYRDALNELSRMVDDNKLDPRCVSALIEHFEGSLDMKSVA